MNHPEVSLVLARAQNGIIGINGGMPWHIPEDLRHFKRITQGKPMIMGRNTFDSLPGILPGRRHIVLTRNADWEEDGVEVAHSFEAALKKANAPHVAVIGGAEIYKLALPVADRIELTEIHADFEGDTHMPALDPNEWTEIAREEKAGNPSYAFVTLVKRNARGD